MSDIELTSEQLAEAARLSNTARPVLSGYKVITLIALVTRGDFIAL